MTLLIAISENTGTMGYIILKLLVYIHNVQLE